MLKKYRESRGWTQQQLADNVNEVTANRPDLRKVTKKNPEGLVDQQTVQRVESGDISLDERWLEIFNLVFNASPNELLGKVSEDETLLLRAFRRFSEPERQAMFRMLGIEPATPAHNNGPRK